MTRPHHKFWPKRLPHAINPPAMPLWDNLGLSARRYPHKPAVIFFGREFHYADLVRLTEPLDEAETDLWLLTHVESRHLRRVSAVYTHLAQALTLP